MICLIQNIEDYNNDLRVGLMAFYPGEKIVIPAQLEKNPEWKEKISFVLIASFDETGIELQICDRYMGIGRLEGEHSDKKPQTVQSGAVRRKIFCNYKKKSETRNRLKLLLYHMLSERTGRVLPWGSLTGVRPTKIAMEAIEKGMTDQEITALYEEVYGASGVKAGLCTEIAHREKTMIDSVNAEEAYCIYIGIPFCPSRCLYCSFTSYPIAQYSNRVRDYLDALEKEIKFAAGAYAGKKPVSVYVGGGTPSSVSAEDMDRLCHMIVQTFDMQDVREFTIEAGRPDSITLEKLQVMKKYGVTRISINPQTMNDETLKLIGRAHTADQTEEIFLLARKAGFDNINMDLIVGLPGEDAAAVRNTMERIRKLAPDSLTVHSLAIKRAASLNQEIDRYRDRFAADIEEQLFTVTECAADMGLNPYYLYRQKNIAGNLENIGFARPGAECIYNILIMEERTDIIGLGAGSSSKLVRKNSEEEIRQNDRKGTRIDRLENVKNVDEYILRIDEMIARKSVMEYGNECRGNI